MDILLSLLVSSKPKKRHADLTEPFSFNPTTTSHFINRQFHSNTYQPILRIMNTFGDQAINITGLSVPMKQVCHQLVEKLFGSNPDDYAASLRNRLNNELKLFPPLLSAFIDIAFDLRLYEEIVFCLYRYHLTQEWFIGNDISESSRIVIHTKQKELSVFNELMLTTLLTNDTNIRSKVANKIHSSQVLNAAFYRVYLKTIVERVGGCSSRGIEDIYNLCELGTLNPYICFEAAELRLYGVSPSINNLRVKPSFTKAHQLYEYSIECGLAVAAWSLGQAYKQLSVLTLDDAPKQLKIDQILEYQLSWYEKALEIDSSYLPAINSKGNIYLEMYPENADAEKTALECFKKAADGGERYACYNYFRRITKNKSFVITKKEAMELVCYLKCAADQGYSPACYAMAMCLSMQCKRYSDDIDWHSLGIEHKFFSNKEAINDLFGCVDTDIENFAKYYFEMAVLSTNNPAVFFDYGCHCAHGTDQQKNVAIAQFEKSADISLHDNNLPLALISYSKAIRLSKLLHNSTKHNELVRKGNEYFKRPQNTSPAILYALSYLSDTLSSAI